MAHICLYVFCLLSPCSFEPLYTNLMLILQADKVIDECEKALKDKKPENKAKRLADVNERYVYYSRLNQHGFQTVLSICIIM